MRFDSPLFALNKLNSRDYVLMTNRSTIYARFAYLHYDKIKKRKKPQVNKNNKTIPENLKKKEYLKSYDELKKDIRTSQQK